MIALSPSTNEMFDTFFSFTASSNQVGLNYCFQYELHEHF